MGDIFEEVPPYAASEERSEEDEERNQDEEEEQDSDSDSDMVIESEDEDVSDREIDDQDPWEKKNSAPRGGRVTEFNL